MGERKWLGYLGAAALLAVLIGIAFRLLFAGRPADGAAQSGSPVASCPLLHAVPSDAEAVWTVSRAGKCLDFLASSPRPLAFALTGGAAPSFLRFVRSLGASGHFKDADAVLSLHWNGAWLPLLVLDAGRSGADTSAAVRSALALADSSGICVRYLSEAAASGPLHRRALLLASRSDVLVHSALRHLEDGRSILDKPGFVTAVASARGTDVLHLSSRCMGRMAEAFLVRGETALLRGSAHLAPWSAWELDALEADRLESDGRFPVPDSGNDWLCRVFSGLPSAESELPRMLPAGVVSACSLPLPDRAAWEERYLKYRDALGHRQMLLERRRALKARAGTTPSDWAASVGIREVAAVRFVQDGRSFRVLLMRADRPQRLALGKEAQPYIFASFLAALYGPLFDVEGEECALLQDAWVVSGAPEALAAWTEACRGRKLHDAWARRGGKSLLPSGSVQFLALSTDGGLVPRLRDAAARSVSGLPGSAWCLTLSSEEGLLHPSLRSVVLEPDGDQPASAESRAARVEVSKGPFEVPNSGTGRSCLFYQNANNALCLKELSGKGIWGVPFSDSICGNACAIDYYGNGRKQILFAAASSLWLIDRLGRFVKSFPVDLGKPVLLGPVAVDVTGTGGWRALILHTDNTLELYNLHGQKAEGWKTIAPSEPVTALPELFVLGKKPYWVIRTTVQTLVYPLTGGKALTGMKGDRRFAPDAVLTQDGNQVRGRCLDGKERSCKL